MSMMTDEPATAEPPVAAPLLEIRDLTAGYGALTVVRDVSLEVHPGEIVSLLGPNGAGKTTTLLACSGLVRISQGEVLVAGGAVRGVAPHVIAKRGLAHIPEDRSLWPTLTVEEHLRLTARPGALDVYDLFPEIARMKNRRAGLLSGGEQQMLALARALSTKPRMLLVDEMSMGLAPVIVDRLFATLKQTAVEQQIGVLLVEQHVHLALGWADRAYVLAGGRIRASGSAEELGERWTDVQASYLGS